MTVELSLPIPPTINHYYGYKGGQVRAKYITKQGKAFRSEVALIAMYSRAIGKFQDARLAIDVTLNMKSRAGDIDNRIKPLFDALEAAQVFDNDRQIDQFSVRRGRIVKGGQCVVLIVRV